MLIVKDNTGYDIPNNCFVMYHGNTVEIIQERGGYLTKILFIAREKVIIRNWLDIFQEISRMEKLTYILNVFDRN